MNLPYFAHDTSPQRLWEDMYNRGVHLRTWHLEYPSAELVSAVAALGLGAPATAVDLGCGAGTEAVFLAQCGMKVHAVDLSSRALWLAADRARRAGVYIESVKSDVLDLPLADASIDFANDRGCFHHITHADRLAYVDELYRVLKPGGRLFLRGCALPNTPPWVALIPAELQALFDAQRFHPPTILPLQFDAYHPIPGLLTLVQKR